MSKVPIIGITCGDTNGVGAEILIKTINRIIGLDIFIIFFGSTNLLDFYNKKNKKSSNFHSISNISDAKKNTINIFNCLEHSLEIIPGKATKQSGYAAHQSLNIATTCTLNRQIDILITMPLSKSTVKQPFIGHTEYLRDKCDVEKSLMFLVTDKLKLATLTNHIPIQAISSQITLKNIYDKLEILSYSLINDFAISNPKIAVLGLNPHNGDNGLIGKEDIDVIKPAITKKQKEGLSVFGPFSADAFFAQKKYKSFHAVLSMYHDQGLIPFKMLSSDDGGVNYTAGLPIIRVSPDHGPAYDIVGKEMVRCESFLKSVKLGIEIYNNR